MSETIVFWVTAVVALGSAVSMLLSSNAVHSALFLVLNLMSLAVLFILLDAQFLGVVQLIVYAGAIMVLFLFVIMLLGVDREESLIEPIKAQRWVAGTLGLAFAAGLVFVLREAFVTSPFRGLEAANEAGNVQALGRVLFSKYLFPFEVTSLLLIVAAIGAMILGRRRDEEEAASEIEVHVTPRGEPEQ